jgi:metal-responsive CopG/Arc/MetJ family transcriptional regulator
LRRKHISLTIDSDILAEIERLRGLAKRNTFIEHIIKIGLKAYNKNNSNQISPKTNTKENDEKPHLSQLTFYLSFDRLKNKKFIYYIV